MRLRSCPCFVSAVDFLCELDEFLNHLLGRDGAVVVGVERLLEFLAEQFRLYQIPCGARLRLALQEFCQQLGRDILVL